MFRNSLQLIFKYKGNFLIENTLHNLLQPVLESYFPEQKVPTTVYRKLYKLYNKNYRVYDLCPELLVYKVNLVLPPKMVINMDTMVKTYPKKEAIYKIPSIFRPSKVLSSILMELYNQLSPYLPKLASISAEYWEWYYNTLYLIHWDDYYKATTLSGRVLKESDYLSLIYKAFIIPCIDSEDKVPLIRNITLRLSHDLKNNLLSSRFNTYISINY